MKVDTIAAWIAFGLMLIAGGGATMYVGLPSATAAGGFVLGLLFGGCAWLFVELRHLAKKGEPDAYEEHVDCYLDFPADLQEGDIYVELEAGKAWHFTSRGWEELSDCLVYNRATTYTNTTSAL